MDIPDPSGDSHATAVTQRKATHPIPSFYIALFLLFLDIAGLLLFSNAAYRLRIGEWHGDQWTITILLGCALMSLYVLDAYRVEEQVSGMRPPVRAIVAILLTGVLSAVIAYVSGYWGNLFGRGVLPVALALFAFWAAMVRYGVGAWLRKRAVNVRWLVLGAGETTYHLLEDFKKSASGGALVVLAADDRERLNASQWESLKISGTLADLGSSDISQYTGVILALSPPLTDDMVQKLMRIRFQGKSIYDISDFYERFWSKVPVMHLHSGWLVFAYGFDLIQNPLGLRLKRVLDVTFALAMLVISLPLMLPLALLIKLDSSGPAVYRQRRVGEGGKTFTLYKFRTMRQDAERDGAQWAITNDARITRVGRLLRVTRLDELPQLVNVMRGNMSFIGPRPERPEFTAMLEKQIPYYDSRYLVKPGITGWAQVHYPGAVEDARKLQYDLYIRTTAVARYIDF